MRWNRIQESWQQLGEHVLARWRMLEESDLEAIDGDRESLLQLICRRYQMPRTAADWQITAWQNAYSDRWLYESAAQMH